MVEFGGEAALPRSVLVADGRLYREIWRARTPSSLLEDLDAMVIPYSGKAEANDSQVASIRGLLLAAGQLTSGCASDQEPL